MAFKPTASLKTLLPDFLAELTARTTTEEDARHELTASGEGSALHGQVSPSAAVGTASIEDNLASSHPVTENVIAPPIESPERAEMPTARPVTEAPQPRYEAADSAESELVAQAQKNPDAFGALYERYVDRVYAYIYHRVGASTHDAEDLTALTFYRALSKLNSYEDRGLPFSAWLFRIAHNLVANWHRDRSRRRFSSLDRLWSHSNDGHTPEQVIEQAEKHDALWEAINRLPKDRKDLLLYKFSNRLSNVEIGELMNKSESAIKSLYFRTLAALRSDLESRDW